MFAQALVERGLLDAFISSVWSALTSLDYYIGEGSLLAHAPAAANIVAATECEILVLAAADFYEITGAFPALWAELKGVADRRVREHAQRLS